MPTYCINAAESVFIVPLIHRRKFNVIRRAAILPVVLVLSSLMFAGPDPSWAQKASAAATPQKVIAIRAANLIDGVAAQPRHNVVIVIKGNKIESVSEGGATPAGATVIHFDRDVTVLPGLIATHPHIFLQGEAPEE